MRALIHRLLSDRQYESLLFRCGVLLYCAVIVVGSIPGARAEMDQVASGLVLHFIAYSVIALLLACGASGNVTRKALKAFLLVSAMGAFDEIVQSALPYRDGALTDWAVDTTAGLFTALLFRVGAGRLQAVST